MTTAHPSGGLGSALSMNPGRCPGTPRGPRTQLIRVKTPDGRERLRADCNLELSDVAGELLLPTSPGLSQLIGDTRVMKAEVPCCKGNLDLSKVKIPQREGTS
jgi:hypothetical protein